MVRLAATAIGAVVGGYFGGPQGAMFGAQAGYFVGSILDPIEGPDPISLHGPTLADLSVSSATYGRPIPIIYGTMRVAGNMIWATDLIPHSITAEIGAPGENAKAKKTGGNLQKHAVGVPLHYLKKQNPGPGPVGFQTTTYYTASFGMGFCEGEADVLKIWMGGDILYDITQDDKTIQVTRQTTIERIALDGGITIYRGTPTQPADDTYQAHVGIANAPAFRNLCYAVFANVAVGKYGNRIPPVEALITTSPSDDIYPYDEIASPTGNTAWNLAAVFSPDLRFLHHVETQQTGGQFVKWDMELQEEVLVVDQDYGTCGIFASEYIDIDRDGYIYVHRGRSTSCSNFLRGNIYKYDPEAYHLVAVSGLTGPIGGLSGDVQLDLRVAGPLDPLLPQYVVVANFLQNRIYSYPTDTLLFEDINNRNEFDITDFDATGSPSQTWTSGNNLHLKLAPDREGMIWAIWEGSGSNSDALISRHDPHTLIPSEWHVIPGASDHGGIFYDILQHNLFIYDEANAILYRWSIDDKEIDGSLAIDLDSGANNAAQFRIGPVFSHIWLELDSGPGSMAEIDLVEMEVVRYITVGNWVTNKNRPIYDPFLNAIILNDFSTTLEKTWIYLDRKDGSAQGVTLESIVSDISDRVVFSSGDYDASDLASDIVPGFAITRRMSARAALSSTARGQVSAMAWRTGSTS